MFSIQQLSEKIAEVSANRLGVDDFEEWFVSESWGHYDGRSNQASRAIAAVHHVLHSCEEGAVEEGKVAQELANAIRPFENTRSNLIQIYWDESGRKSCQQPLLESELRQSLRVDLGGKAGRSASTTAAERRPPGQSQACYREKLHAQV